jgi:hypothetical protein
MEVLRCRLLRRRFQPSFLGEFDKAALSQVARETVRGIAPQEAHMVFVLYSLLQFLRER